MAKPATRAVRNVRVRYEGPFFSTFRDDVIEKFEADVVADLDRRVNDNIHQRLDIVLKHPTGAFERSITTDRQRDDIHIVHGDQIVYGAWLEGVADRNKGSRFKGYSTFRKAARWMSTKSKGIANDIFERKYLGRLN